MTDASNKLSKKPIISLPAEKKSQSSIEEQTAAFLKRGGEVQQIPTGRTGYTASTGRSIKLGGTPRTAKG